MGNTEPGRPPQPPGMPWAAGPQPGQPMPGQGMPARPVPLGGSAAPRPIPLGAGGAPIQLTPGAQVPGVPTPGMPARPMPVVPGAPVAQPLAPTSPAQRPVLREQTPEDEQRPEIEKVVKGAPPYLVSGIVHMTVLIVLGLWILVEPPDNTISLEVVYSDEEGEQLEMETLEIGAEDSLAEEEVITPSDLMPVEDPLQAPALVDFSPVGNTQTSDKSAPQIGMFLKGRTAGMRSTLMRKYGGNAITDGAVKSALDWLVRNQQKDGSWSLSGPYSGGFSGENQHAATAMALLALQGDGHTHDKNKATPYSKAVARGWEWMLKNQDAEGCFYGDGPSHSRLYSHAQATIAICELYAMTNDTKFQKPAQLAVNYCISAQGPNGGWRYNRGQNGDTSVTGWYMMALQSAKMGYLVVPDDVLTRTSGFLDTVQADGGRKYGYLGPNDVRPSMTAEGLLCRQYLGWEHDDERLIDGVEFLTENMINWDERNCYYWYYATQVLHHMEGEPWKRWNEVMRELLPAKQEKKGAERGSWDPDGDQWGPQGGRLYVTCLHVYMLEVYYRHLPIYKYKMGQF